MSFKNFTGNMHLKKQLSRIVSTGNILNSYIFSGDEGIGKKTLAKAFIASLLCKEKTDSYCGNCPDCAKVLSGNHPDIITLLKQKDKKTLGIEEVREQIIKEAYVKPFIADRKIFFIPDGDDLTQEAQNGLLKILEEPPQYVTFIILTTKTSYLLDTVLSRSCLFALHPVKKGEVYEFLKNKHPQFSDEDISFSSSFSQGNIGKAEKMLTDEDYKDLFFKTFEHISNLFKSSEALVHFHRFMLDNKDKIDEIIDFFLIYLRDAILCTEGLFSIAICPDYLKCESFLDISVYTHALESVIKYKNSLASNVNFTIFSLDLLTEIQENFNIN